MPLVVNRQDWETAFRGQVRKLVTGWNVAEFRGKVRPPGQAEQLVILPFRWDAHNTGDAYISIRNVYKLVAEGYSLKGAAEIAEGKAPMPATDWAGALERFKVQKLQHGRSIKPGTWNHSYEPVLSDAVKMLAGRLPPSNPADILDLSIRKWEPGSRMRQIRAQSLAQFLRHCVNREHFPVLWLPPADLRSHVGAKGAQAGPGLKGDRSPIS